MADPAQTLPLYRAVEEAMGDGLIRSAATPSRGGWAVCWARCVLAAGLGLELDLDDAGGIDSDRFLFSESAGRLLVTTSADDAEAFAKRMQGFACRRAGSVTETSGLRVTAQGAPWLSVDEGRLRAAFRETLGDE